METQDDFDFSMKCRNACLMTSHADRCECLIYVLDEVAELAQSKSLAIFVIELCHTYRGVGSSYEQVPVASLLAISPKSLVDPKL